MPAKTKSQTQQLSATVDSDGLSSIVRHTLPNGLRVWVKPRPGTDTMAILGQVPVGSRHETEANNGISHFVEHMVFTGTKRWSEQEVMEVIRRQGGYVNARTAREDTIYWLHLKADDLSLGIDWMGEVLLRPQLSAEKFEKERAVIITEKGGKFGRFEDLIEWIEDRGWGWNVFRAARHHLWGAEHNLQQPIIGRDKSLGAISHNQLLAFYKQHYMPNNITLLFVGDCEPQQV
ncbi:MAG: pitrilysin family protein, partial [Acidiferrobacterales bacterium]